MIVEEKVTKRLGTVQPDGKVLFPELKGQLRLDGTYDDGIREIPSRLLTVIKGAKK